MEFSEAVNNILSLKKIAIVEAIKFINEGDNHYNSYIRVVIFCQSLNLTDVLNDPLIGYANDFKFSNKGFIMIMEKDPVQKLGMPSTFWLDGKDWKERVGISNEGLSHLEKYLSEHDIATGYHILVNREIIIKEIVRSFNC